MRLRIGGLQSKPGRYLPGFFGLGFGIPPLLLSFLPGAAQRWITRQFAIRARLTNLVSVVLLLGVGACDLSANWPLLQSYFV